MVELMLREGALWYTVPALLGTGVFVLRLVLMLVGLAGHELEIEVGGDGLDAHHGDPSEAFQVLSVQSIAAFLMGFGWGGLGAYVGSDLGALKSTIVGLAVGAGMMWLLAKFLRSLYRLQTSGNIEIADAVGCEGAVYLSVPEAGAGRGQVRVTVEGRDRIFNAVTEGEALPTGARARVVRANPDNTVTVCGVAV